MYFVFCVLTEMAQLCLLCVVLFDEVGPISSTFVFCPLTKMTHFCLSCGLFVDGDEPIRFVVFLSFEEDYPMLYISCFVF